MTAGKTVLVAGARGIVGRAALAHFEAAGVPVIGPARRPDPTARVPWIAADLLDAAGLDAALAGAGEVTHLVYAALHEEPDLIGGWTGEKQIATNLAMLRNLVTALEARAPGLRHITLLQGTKAYGIHHGPFPVPGRESDPDFIAPNFYYDQQDWLRERAAGAAWTFTILRPQLVCGFALGNPMNAVAAIGVYGAICRELGQPFRFSGGEPCIMEAVDSGLLARAIAWAGEEPRCAGETYNITNGDVFSWPVLWPRLARMLGVEPGPAHPHALARVMPGHRRTWTRIVERHGLKPLAYDEVVANWAFLDFTLRHGETKPRHSLMSTIKCRQHGFADCVDTEEMFARLFREFEDAGVLPRPGRASALSPAQQRPAA